MPRLSPVRAAWNAGAVLVLAAAPAAAMDPSPSPAASPAASAAPFESILDDRYCEIIPSVTEGDTTSTYVYNTIGFSDCPTASWIRLSEDDINTAFGSDSVKKNGPRHWTLDAITAVGGATTSGEMRAEEKNAISHRARAARAIAHGPPVPWRATCARAAGRPRPPRRPVDRARRRDMTTRRGPGRPRSSGASGVERAAQR